MPINFGFVCGWSFLMIWIHLWLSNLDIKWKYSIVLHPSPTVVVPTIILEFELHNFVFLLSTVNKREVTKKKKKRLYELRALVPVSQNLDTYCSSMCCLYWIDDSESWRKTEYLISYHKRYIKGIGAYCIDKHEMSPWRFLQRLQLQPFTTIWLWILLVSIKLEGVHFHLLVCFSQLIFDV